jgi:hypothetical protein
MERSPDRPFLGSVRFPSDRGEIGRAAEALRCFLAERHQMHGGFTDIVFEAQHVAGKMDMNVLHRLIGLATMAEWFAHRIGARCYTVPIGSWRKHAFGNGHMKRDEAKRRAMEECRALGFDPSNNNEAEAFFVLDYYIALRNKHGAGIPQPWRDNSFFDRTGAKR